MSEPTTITAAELLALTDEDVAELEALEGDPTAYLNWWRGIRAEFVGKP